jgi:hypothetical protein
MCVDDILDNVQVRMARDGTIKVHVHYLAIQGLEMVHRCRIAFSRDDHLDTFWKYARQPKGHICFSVEIILFTEMVNALENENHLIVDVFGVLHYLLIQLLVAQLEPIREVTTQLLLQQLDLLSDV